MELDAWLDPFRRFWSKHVDALEQHLDKMDEGALCERKEKDMSSRDQYAPGAASGAEVQKGWREVDARSRPRPRATLPPRFGRRSPTPSISANGLRSILTGTSVPLAPRSSRPWERRRRMSPRPR